VTDAIVAVSASGVPHPADRLSQGGVVLLVRGRLVNIPRKNFALTLVSPAAGSAVAQTPAGSTHGPSPESVYQTYLSAVNAGNAQAVRDLLDPDLKMNRRPPACDSATMSSFTRKLS